MTIRDGCIDFPGHWPKAFKQVGVNTAINRKVHRLCQSGDLKSLCAHLLIEFVNGLLARQELVRDPQRIVDMVAAISVADIESRLTTPQVAA